MGPYVFYEALSTKTIVALFDWVYGHIYFDFITLCIESRCKVT